MKVIVKNKKIYRKAENINDSLKIMSVLEKHNYFKNKVVETCISTEEENTLEHKYISPIIHSGEYTTSMAYDVTKCALDMAIELIDDKIFSFDLLPHNFTYHNGEWLLYDFGSFETHPKNVKTQLRGTFKITFSSFELLKKLDRKAIKHCFLNRINHFYLFKMISHKNWFLWCLTQYYCLLLYKLRLYKKSYLQLQKYFNKYEKAYKRETYNFTTTNQEKDLYKYIDEILNQNNIKTTFGLGEKSAQWASNSQNNSTKFIYLDNYDICDKYYNFIYKNNHKNISTAVIYPFMQDKEINENLTYRGIYDYFAKERYNAQAVVILNSDELYLSKDFQVDKFAEHIAEFSTYLYFHAFAKENEQDLAQKIKNEVEKYFNNVNLIEKNEKIILVATSKKYPPKDYSNLKQYINNNRGPEAKQQSLEIINIINAQ